MIRLFLRSIAINVLGIYLTIQVLSGMIVYIGGIKTLLLAGLAIALINLFIRPIVNLLLLPINLVTLGVFRWVANLVTLYLVNKFIPNFDIRPTDFSGINVGFLIIPPMHLSIFMSFIVATLVLTVVFHIIYWLFQD